MRMAAGGIQGSAVPADNIAMLTDACATLRDRPTRTTRRVVGKVAAEAAWKRSRDLVGAH